MILPPAILEAVIAELERSLAADDKAHADAVIAAASLDEFIRTTARSRVDKEHRIEQLKRLREMDPHAARTPVPPPPLAMPPGMTLPPRLTPPPRRKR